MKPRLSPAFLDSGGRTPANTLKTTGRGMLTGGGMEKRVGAGGGGVVGVGGWCVAQGKKVVME